MKHRSLAVMGLASPILIGVCVFAMVGMGLLSWVIFGGGNQNGITKIATVGPFFSAKILPGLTPEAQLAEANLGEAPNAVSAEATVVLPTPLPQAVAAALTQQEFTQQRGFALPDNTVNLLTQEGVGTRLVIPTMSLDAPILLAPIENQTWKVDHLKQEIGHLEGTAKPGSNSNLVLAAHVTLEDGSYGPFAGLANLTPGDTIEVYEGGNKFHYVIDSHQTVDPSAVAVTYPSETGQITLITCNSWDQDQGRYVERLVVKGHLLNN